MCVFVWLYSQDPASLSLLSISDLVPDLQFIFFWMSNAIEILYFIQQKSPAYMQTIELLDDKGMKRSRLFPLKIVSKPRVNGILGFLVLYVLHCSYFIQD